MAKRAVVCRQCGMKGYSDVFFHHISANNQKMYFCDENCYIEMSKDGLKVEEIIHFVRDATGANTFSKQTNNQIRQLIALYVENNMLDSLHFILKTRRFNIRTYLDTKDFAYDRVRVKYLFIMIDDEVVKEHKQRITMQKRQEQIPDIEHIETKPCANTDNNKTKKRGRGISEFL